MKQIENFNNLRNAMYTINDKEYKSTAKGNFMISAEVSGKEVIHDAIDCLMMLQSNDATIDIHWE